MIGHGMGGAGYGGPNRLTLERTGKSAGAEGEKDTGPAQGAKRGYGHVRDRLDNPITKDMPRELAARGDFELYHGMRGPGLQNVPT